jgi:proteasome alpha subunit
MAGQGAGGYDRGVTLFAPDGKVMQIEYARNAANTSSTIIGIEASDGVVLLAIKNAEKLLKSGSSERIFQIDEHIGLAISGLVGDARKLIDMAIIEAESNKVKYDELINVYSLTKKICDYKQAFTQYGGFRPFGVIMLIAGVYDGNAHLFQTDPSGAFLEYRAAAAGNGKDLAQKILKEEYDENITIENAVLLGIEALKEVVDKTKQGEINSATVDIGIAEITKNKFRILDDQEIEIYI